MPSEQPTRLADPLSPSVLVTSLQHTHLCGHRCVASMGPSAPSQSLPAATAPGTHLWSRTGPSQWVSGESPTGGGKKGMSLPTHKGLQGQRHNQDAFKSTVSEQCDLYQQTTFYLQVHRDLTLQCNKNTNLTFKKKKRNCIQPQAKCYKTT